MRAQVEVDGDTFICLEMAKSLIDYITPRAIKRVTIDRNEGLTLFGEDNRRLFHATGLLCGYSGTGPSGSVETLRHAEFAVDAKQVELEPSIDLSK